jgi:hypothetical protein
VNGTPSRLLAAKRKKSCYVQCAHNRIFVNIRPFPKTPSNLLKDKINGSVLKWSIEDHFWLKIHKGCSGNLILRKAYYFQYLVTTFNNQSKDFQL